MTTKISHGQAASNGARFMWMGFAMGLACMAALFIAGLATGSSGMVVMASSSAAALGAAWSATSSAARKKAAGPRA